MKKLFTLIILSITLFSCQADTDEIIVPDPEETGNDSIYVKSLIAYDTTQLSGRDTITKAEFSYDDLKRVSKARFIYFESGETKPYEWYEYQWFYQSSDTLPYKLTERWGEFATPQTAIYQDTLFFTYTGTMITGDSVMSHAINQSPRNDIWSLKPLAGDKKLQTIIVKYLGQQGEVYVIDTLRAVKQIVWNNGNRISDRDSSYMDGRINESSYSYDNHPNPFFRVSIPSEMYFTHESTISQRTANNITRSTAKEAGLPAWDISIRYEYRKDGYPVIYRVTGAPFKAIISYTK